MIDLKLLREDTQRVIDAIAKKDPSFDTVQLVKLDKKVLDLRQQIDDLRHKKNELAAKAKQGVTEELRTQSLALSTQLKDFEASLERAETEFMSLYLYCPNILDQAVPVGNKEQNVVIKTFKSKPSFSFPVRNHVDLGTQLGWFNMHAAAQMTKSNFIVYQTEAVKLLYALAMFMLKNNSEHGFEVVLPPYLVNAQSLQNASNFPKFKDQVYAIQDEDLYLSPTSEVNITNMYRDTILAPEQLPIRKTAWTSCFRREAGTYGSAERGLIRIHQFEKVELYSIVHPENSAQEQERMLACAEAILQKLDLHYRVSLLAAQDCSFPSAKTYDIEVWLPGQQAYYEVSSCSNCTDFQARRTGIRFKEAGGKKNHLVHTLNCSSLALPRLMVAIMETYQQADGSIAIPAILKGYGLY